MKVLNINLTNEEKMMLEDELVGIEYPTNNYDLYILEIIKFYTNIELFLKML